MPAVIELMLRMLYCEKAVINYDRALLLSDIRREERDDSRKGKKIKKSDFIMKSSIRVCLLRKSSE